MAYLRTWFALALAAALLVLAPPGLAQSTPVQGSVQAQMGPEEFNASKPGVPGSWFMRIHGYKTGIKVRRNR